MISPSCLEICGGEANVYVSLLSAVVMVAWYTTSFTKHCPVKGHLFGSLQLQSFGPGAHFIRCCILSQDGFVVSIDDLFYFR